MNYVVKPFLLGMQTPVSLTGSAAEDNNDNSFTAPLELANRKRDIYVKTHTASSIDHE